MTKLVARSVAIGLGLAALSGSSLSAQAVPADAGPADTLTLLEVVTTALERGPELAAARAQVDAASAGRDQARAAWLPSLAGSGTLNRFEEPMIVAPIHAFDPANAPDFARTLTQGRLTMIWTVFDGGARRARVAGASARVQGSEAAAGSATMDAVLEALEAYLAVQGARDALAAQRTRAEEVEAELARATRLVGEGAAPRLEQLRAEAELEAVRAQGIGLDAARAVAEEELARIMGAPGAPIGSLALREVRADPIPHPLASAPLSVHPLVRQASGRVAAAEAIAREARSARLPRVTGTGGLTEYGAGTRDFTGEWQAGLQLDYPIFTGGARRARIDEMDAEVRRARAEAAAIEDQLARAVARARAAVEGADARTAALGSAVERFDELARVEALALAEGAGMQSDYLRALAALHAARVALADARRAEVATRARLARAQGWLYLEWIETQLEGER